MGLTAGAVIMLMSVTGAMLGFEHQLVDWIDGQPIVANAEGASRLSVDSLLRLQGVPSSAVSQLVLRAEPSQPVQLRVRGPAGGLRYVDPYTGKTLPGPVPRIRPILTALRPIHRVLGVNDGPLGVVTRRITGIANLGFVLLTLSGLLLWIPRRWTAAILRSSFVPGLRLRGKPRDFSWHTTFGFWLALPIAFVAGTAVFMSFRWPGRWLDRLAGSPSERAVATGVATTPQTGRPKNRAVSPFVNSAVQQAMTARPDWRAITVSLAGPADTATQVLVASGNTFRPDKRSTLYFEPESLALIRSVSYGDLSTSRKLRAWVRYGHTGEAFGVFGQGVATLASLVGALLVWTGIALAWRRWWAWLRRRRVGITTTAG